MDALHCRGNVALITCVRSDQHVFSLKNIYFLIYLLFQRFTVPLTMVSPALRAAARSAYRDLYRASSSTFAGE